MAYVIFGADDDDDDDAAALESPAPPAAAAAAAAAAEEAGDGPIVKPRPRGSRISSWSSSMAQISRYRRSSAWNAWRGGEEGGGGIVQRRGGLSSAGGLAMLRGSGTPKLRARGCEETPKPH